MAVFTVLNGTGINGAGVQFGTLSQIAAGGIAGNPNFTPTSGSINFVNGGRLTFVGVGMDFDQPLTFSGTVSSMTYSNPASTPIFSLTGMNIPLATLAGLATGGDENAILATIFAGADQISGSTQNDVLKGYDGNDIVRGGAGADALDGGNGNDILIGGAGADTLNGGSGTDTASYSSSGVAVTVNLGAGTATDGDAAGDVLTSIENLTGSAFDDTLTGNAGVNQIAGGAGQDTLAGAGGNDVLLGGDGGDQLDGGAGNDTISGGTGIDVLTGGIGSDLLNGGADADAIDGGTGVDTVDYDGSGTGVTVNLATNTNTGGYAEGDTLSGIEIVQGSAFGDTLTGNGGTNTLRGMGGNDVLDGGAGWDTLEGGAGDDQLNGGTEGDVLRGGLGADQLAGGSGFDIASYYDSAVGVTIDLQTQVHAGGTAQGDAIANDVETINGSVHADTMTGNGLGNALIGFEGADTLSGGGGSDILRGGHGADTLNGGAGADIFSYTFFFESTAVAADTIQDFQAGVDVISLKTVDAFTFIGTSAFSNTVGQLRYEIAGSITTVSADINGDSVADMVIHLDGAFALQASNFLL
jgi:Ca2+-binding RTX toxin-like protein